MALFNNLNFYLIWSNLFSELAFLLSQKIENLETCCNMERLYLYGNEITKIENLGHMVHMEELWLNNNQIENVEVMWNACLCFELIILSWFSLIGLQYVYYVMA